MRNNGLKAAQVNAQVNPNVWCSCEPSRKGKWIHHNLVVRSVVHRCVTKWADRIFSHLEPHIEHRPINLSFFMFADMYIYILISISIKYHLVTAHWSHRGASKWKKAAMNRCNLWSFSMLKQCKLRLSDIHKMPLIRWIWRLFWRCRMADNIVIYFVSHFVLICFDLFCFT